jgi:outer membrane protein
MKSMIYEYQKSNFKIKVKALVFALSISIVACNKPVEAVKEVKPLT